MNKKSKTGTLLLFVFLGLAFLLSIGPAQPPRARAAGYDQKLYLPNVANRTEGPWWFGPSGGSVISLVSDPQNPNNVYAGSDGAGVFKSTDGGQSWLRTAGIQNFSIDSLAIDQRNPMVLYAGTHGQGVYKSSNAGLGWHAVNAGIAPNSVVYTLTVSPGNSNIAYAGTRIQNTLDGVLYKTVNGGESWYPVYKQSNDWIYSVRANPNEPYRMLAAAHEHGPYFASNYGGEGDWQPANLNGSECPNDECLKGRAVAFDPRSWTGLAYYATWHGEFFRSTNNGRDEQLSNSGVGNAHIYPNGISVKPGDPDMVYMAVHSGDVTGVLRSSNTGQSWSSAGLNGKTVYSVEALAGSGSNLLAGTYQEGLFRSTNGGTSWASSIKGLYNTQVTGMVFVDSSTILASTYGEAGVYRSNDKGQTWSEYRNGLIARYIVGLVQSPINPNYVYALTDSSGLRRLDLRTGVWASIGSFAVGPNDVRPPSGQPRLESRWEPLDELRQLEGEDQPAPQIEPEGDFAPTASTGLSALVFAPSNPNIAYLGTEGKGVYASSNGGSSWAPVGLAGKTVRRLLVAPTDPLRLYAATTQNGTVKISKDGGHTWLDIPFADSSLVIRCLAFVEGKPNILYAGTNHGVWKLIGVTWEPAGLQDYSVKVLTTNPFAPGMLLAGTDGIPGTNLGGAFYTADGQNWTLLNIQLENVPIQSIHFNPRDNYRVYIGTITRGAVRVVWRK